MTLGEPTESEKQVMQAKSYISDSFDYSHEFQNYGEKHMIFDLFDSYTSIYLIATYRSDYGVSITKVTHLET